MLGNLVVQQHMRRAARRRRDVGGHGAVLRRGKVRAADRDEAALDELVDQVGEPVGIDDAIGVGVGDGVGVAVGVGVGVAVGIGVGVGVADELKAVYV